MAHNYILQVTAGPSYDTKTHQVVAVNTADPLSISSEHISIDLNVRVQHYRGLPPSSPSTSPYFSLPAHSKSNDQYSIAFRFTPHTSINGDDLVFGNDFDHPIRDRLPPGFGTAFKIVKWAVDPGLDGDVYADKPYLYGPLASSLNTLRVGESGVAPGERRGLEMGDDGEGMVFEEGGLGDGELLRTEKGVPETDAARKKWFLTEENRKAWEFEAGREHFGDFFNPYLDFNEFAIRLPGFHLPIMRYWDGQGLRYVLKNRKTDDVYLVVLFTLYLKEDVNEDGTIKEGVVGGKLLQDLPSVDRSHEAAATTDDDDDDDDDDDADDEEDHGTVANGKIQEGGQNRAIVETSADDLD